MDGQILFAGGVSGCSTSVLPLDLSRLKCNLFGCKNREKRTLGPNAPNYSEKVLVGNWFERRSSNYHQPTDECLTTVYNTHYKPHVVKDINEDVYTVWKNKQKTLGADRPPIIDGDVYRNNMTTTYDINYRIHPKNLCGPEIRVYNARKNLWIPEADLTRSYGNQTKYHLVDAVKAKQAEYINQEQISPWKSIYNVDYYKREVAPKDLNVKRFPKLRGDMNTPDLRHLGIELSSSNSKLPAREPRWESIVYSMLHNNLTDELVTKLGISD